jgi:flagellar protein FlaJ
MDTNLIMDTKYIFLISLAIAIVLLVLSFLVWGTSLSMNLILIGVVILILPMFLVKFFEFKKVKQYEKEFPNFLRAMAESQRAGLSTLQAIDAAAESEYGSLTPKLKKLKNQLSWGIGLEESLEKFASSTKSMLVKRAVAVIIQANKSGGDIENIMMSLANNIEENMELQEERGTLLAQHVIMMYAIFFIFLGISVALVKFLVPIVSIQTEAGLGAVLGGGQGNPCLVCMDGGGMECMSCNLFFGISEIFNLGVRTDPISYYKALFLSMVLIQGLFSGLIAGQISADSVIAGVKHSMIMVVSGVVVFVLAATVGFI